MAVFTFAVTVASSTYWPVVSCLPLACLSSVAHAPSASAAATAAAIREILMSRLLSKLIVLRLQNSCRSPCGHAPLHAGFPVVHLLLGFVLLEAVALLD